MDSVFYLQLFLSFVIGGMWVALVTLVSERIGTKLGGYLGGLPSTVIVSLFFIGLVQSPTAAAEATTLVPLTCGLNGVFIIAYVLLLPFGLGVALSSALILWLALVLLTLFRLDHSFFFSLLGWGILLLLSFRVLEHGLRIPSLVGSSVTPSHKQMFIRALLSGTMVAFAVYLSKIAGPNIGGVFACFPALFISTLFISHLSRGPEASKAVAKSLALSGLINVVFYALFVRFFYPVSGLFLGTLAALCLSFITGYVVFQLMGKRLA